MTVDELADQVARHQVALTAALNAKCRHCQRPMAAHCDGCGACWPNDACALDCDVNAPHPSWTEPEL